MYNRESYQTHSTVMLLASASNWQATQTMVCNPERRKGRTLGRRPQPCTRDSPMSAPVTPHSEGSPGDIWPALRSDSPLLGIKVGLGKGRGWCPAAATLPHQPWHQALPTGQLQLSGSYFLFPLKTWSALSTALITTFQFLNECTGLLLGHPALRPILFNIQTH